MKLRIVALAFAFAATVVAGPSFAADVVKVKPLAAPIVVKPVNLFQGAYFGLHGGWGTSDATSRYNNDYFNQYCGYSYPWGCPVDVDPAGAFVGGQIGVNIVHPNGVMFGIQGDY